MKRFLSSLLIAIAFLSTTVVVSTPLVEARSYRTNSSDVYIKGYYRKNGTYVQPYYRTRPNSIKLDNYGCIDHGRCR